MGAKWLPLVVVLWQVGCQASLGAPNDDMPDLIPASVLLAVCATWEEESLSSIRNELLSELVKNLQIEHVDRLQAFLKKGRLRKELAESFDIERLANMLNTIKARIAQKKGPEGVEVREVEKLLKAMTAVEVREVFFPLPLKYLVFNRTFTDVEDSLESVWVACGPASVEQPIKTAGEVKVRASLLAERLRSVPVQVPKENKRCVWRPIEPGGIWPKDEVLVRIIGPIPGWAVPCSTSGVIIETDGQGVLGFREWYWVPLEHTAGGGWKVGEVVKIAHEM